MNIDYVDLLSKQKVLPILRSKDPQVIVDTVDAIEKGGFNIVEINIESPEVYEAIKEVSDKVMVCAGGIITSMQAQAAFEAGARFISSPIFHINLLKYAKDKGQLYIAGTSTANEAYNAWKSRIPMVKIYPADAMGGAMYIKNMLRPMPFLKVIAQGNVRLFDVEDYITAGAVCVGIGRDLLKDASYSEITERIQKFRGRYA